ncbi:pseudouridine synthase [Sinanaerobacter chloroacetimidivorans]|jgi:23S rRNA pseudouridine2605 synthase|uniref:rRNA pseudouridine synthase n=1 Tax=Sinanaerobacter chloroacetimidivorans TaxID=2818044 RepID=A0A8J8B3X6_9FIRM|nr:pseudouridine synthase [Sinanaerobacter chloroacetimidivorans]MBR0600172.1 rRNA pseudouridine synthase [Sinanaerobacter chloroacetimidivorans]
MRLNKYIAQAGIASRRKADELTQQGKVKVNGMIMKEMGYDVAEGDVVEVNGQTIRKDAKKVYIMLNKPIGYITSTEDERSRPTVMTLVNDIEERVFPIGRLDYNTSGMLLMTNDGELAYKLTHPKHHVYKTYRARVSGQLSNEKIYKLRNGVDIGGFVTSKAIVNVIKQAERSAIVEIKIFEGKNRQVRKMFAAVGNKVLELERVAIGELYLGHLRQGHYRKLTAKEIEYLKEC